jgi:hypothetical protein
VSSLKSRSSGGFTRDKIQQIFLISRECLAESDLVSVELMAG